jgi:hypothetical protein
MSLGSSQSPDYNTFSRGVGFLCEKSKVIKPVELNGKNFNILDSQITKAHQKGPGKLDPNNAFGMGG